MLQRGVPSWTARFFSCVGAVWLLAVPWAEAAAPTVVLSPTTDPISSPDEAATFFFNHPAGMDRSAIDVTWEGTGIDASKITYEWSPPLLPGIALPAISLLCTYEGGWPPNVMGTWTLNRGNSGIMKSATGEILAEVSGLFATVFAPGGGSDGVTITPSATQLTVGQKLTFTFSVAMDTSIDAEAIFTIGEGEWQSTWESPTVLSATLMGGIDSGDVIATSYTLFGLSTAAGDDVPDFSSDISLSGPAGGNGPTVIPPTGLINGKATFVFDRPMDPAGLDVRWSGIGIDPTKITSQWLVVNIPGVPVPVSTFEASYQGGWPSTTAVTWVLNQGNSGVIKSADGVPLAEVSGTFVTPVISGGGPGPDPGDCEPSVDDGSSAAITLFKEINFVQTGTQDPVFDTVEKAMVNASVFTSPSNAPAAVVQSATLNKPGGGGSVPLQKLEFEIPDIDLPGVPGISIPDLPDNFFLSMTPAPEITPPTFGSLAELEAAYPNGAYSMTVSFSGGGNRTVALPLNPSPEPPAPKIANLAALQGFDPTKNLTIEWNLFAGAGSMDLIQLRLRERNGSSSYAAPNKCANIELLVTDTSHTIPAGTLKAGVTYDLELSFSKAVHVWQAQTAQANDHISGYSEFTLFSKTTRTTVGAPFAAADLRFTKALTETVAGKRMLTMEISGSLGSASIGHVEGSTDLIHWTDTGIVVTQAGLDALGGVLVTQDPTLLSGTLPPFKFYRIRIE